MNAVSIRPEAPTIQAKMNLSFQLQKKKSFKMTRQDQDKIKPLTPSLEACRLCWNYLNALEIWQTNAHMENEKQKLLDILEPIVERGVK